MITHLLFDCDGTLVDSERIAMSAMRQAAQQLGVILSLEDCCRLFLGHSRQHCLAVMAQLAGAPLPEGFAAGLAATIRHQLEQGLHAIAGVKRMLSEVAAVKCVISNGSPEHIAFVLSKAGLSGLIDGPCFSAIQPCPPKPSPLIYLQAMAAIEIEPAMCLAIEDSITGVAAATAAGIRTLGFAMLTSRQQLLQAGASTTFDCMTTLPALIQSLDAAQGIALDTCGARS